MEDINKSPVLRFITSIKDNPAIFKTSVLILIFSIYYFFTFYYGHSNTRQPFDFLLLNFHVYVFICLLISFLSFYKKISFWKTFLFFSAIWVALIFIPAGFGSAGLSLINDYLFIIGLLSLSKVISLCTDPIYTNSFLNIVMSLILAIITIFFIALNLNDLTVKRNIEYHNNAMFETIEECSDYILPKRENDCKNKFIEMHDRWEKMNR